MSARAAVEGASDPAPVSGSSTDTSTVLIKIMSPATHVPSDLVFRVAPDSTVKELKDKIGASLDNRPTADDQKLIYRGKLLANELVIASVLGLSTAADGKNENTQSEHIFHLVPLPPGTSSFLHPAPVSSSSSSNSSSTSSRGPSFPPGRLFNNQQLGPTSFVRQRINDTVTQRNAAMNVSTVAASGASTGISVPASRIPKPSTTRLGSSASSHHGHVRTALPSSGIPTPTATSSGSNSSFATPSADAPNNNIIDAATDTNVSIQRLHERVSRPLETISRLHQDLAPSPPPAYRSYEERNRREASGLRQEQHETATNVTLQTPTVQTETVPTAARQNTAVQTVPAETQSTGTEAAPMAAPMGSHVIYLLQDPQGRPSSLLIGPGYTGAAGISSDGLMWGVLGPQMDVTNVNAGGPQQRGYQAVIVPNAPVLGGAANDQFNAGRAQMMNQQQVNVGEMLRVFRARATHFWLIIRLMVFIFMFTGGSGGWRRVAYIGFIAFMIFLYQTGLLSLLARTFIDVINPPPPNNNNAALGQNGNPTDPAQMAQVLLQRRQDRMRNILRNFEGAITMFFASLVPGLHEGHINALAQEQRQQREAAVAQDANAGEDGVGGAAAPAPPAQENDVQDLGEVEMLGGVL